jgi:hypothetical protein
VSLHREEVGGLRAETPWSVVKIIK